MSAELTARGLRWYRRTFFAHATSEAVLGEKSTSYLEDGEAAGRAAAVLGPADIVVQLRDPVERAVSNWRFSRANGLEERPLEQALEDNLAGPRGWDRCAVSVSPYAYLERGRYDDYLQPWFAQFPGRVHVRFTEELASLGAGVARLYEALGVDPAFAPPDPERPVNASAGAPPPMSEALRQRLRAYFRDSDARLRERLGRELPWAGS